MHESEDLKTVELIATVSHEIRSPLTTIKGFTKTLIDRWDKLSDEMKQDMLRAINADADRVTRLLNELLDVSRLEAGRLSVHLQRVDVRELVSVAVAEFVERSEAHEVRLAGDDSVEAMGDPDKLRQVLTNFIENALKYTDGGVVTVSYTREGDRVRISVNDEGEGIPEKYLPLVFDKFSRNDLPGSPSGTGLGMYISKGLIEAQGGEIGVTSSEGSGSTFWFVLSAAEEL